MLRWLKSETKIPKQKKYQRRVNMERQKCEIYSRVVGFLTPVSQWNRGKKEEFKDRKTYDKVLREVKNGERVKLLTR